MKCYLIKDLLPNYIDGLTNEETSTDIKNHLADCPECSTVYESMLAAVPQKILPEDKDIDFLKKLKKRLMRKNIMISVFTCIVLLIGFLSFARFYEIPLPFDGFRMSVELVPSAIITDESGRISWEKLESAIYRGVVPENYHNTMDVLNLSYKGINDISERSVGRTINRNGENVRVIYYCYIKTLWNTLFVYPDFVGYSEGGSSTGSTIYGDSYESADYQPQRIEVYYLPIRNLEKIDQLTDDEYDKLKERCELIWSGVV